MGENGRDHFKIDVLAVGSGAGGRLVRTGPCSGHGVSDRGNLAERPLRATPTDKEMGTMKLYWSPRSRSVRILWLLEEAGLPYERVRIDLRDPAAKADPAFRAISPMGKVPAFEDGPARLWDSGAIAVYIGDQYPETGLAPAVGHPDRGAYLQWVMYTNAAIEPAMCEKFANLPSNPSQYGWGSWDLMLSTLRKGLEKGPWILGDRFSAADVLLGSSAMFMRDFKMLTDDPVLFDYADRCAARPAHQRSAALQTAE
jgi:glutathione S-transferase